jgi:RpiB/LacA/LacB family sugar-phosphate isomerase
MIVAIGSDHAGFELKRFLVKSLRNEKYKTLDLGAHNPKPSDYPDYAEKVGLALLNGRARRGILICGSGVGAAVAANKIPRIRAGLCHDTYSAHQGVEHDDMNVLVLGSRVVGWELARELALTFLAAAFTKEARHKRRLEKIHSLEVRYGYTDPENQSVDRIKKLRSVRLA